MMMRNIFLIGLLIFGVTGLKAQTKKNFELIWSDEFNYSGLPDSTKWSYDVGGHGWGNNEQEFYTDHRSENARVGNGVLTIEARKEPYKGKDYTSARLVTKDKGDWLYGRFEIRAKLPKGRGTWPAIWMLSSDWAYGSWPESGEIDIMEHVGYDPDVIHFSTHCLDYYFKIGTQKTAIMKAPRTDSLFYTYAVEWYPDSIRGFIDDSLYFNIKNERLGWTKWPFDKRFHLILNIAVGGFWGAVMGIDDNIWPQKMEVDYVRVYKYLSGKDTEAPSAATKLESIATDNRIWLTWQPAYDNYGVKEYEIFCNDKSIGKTLLHSFQVKDLKPATAYNFKVVALDWAGNASKPLASTISTNTAAKNIVPGKIEAENFKSEMGTIMEHTSDSLGGVNVGWIDPGDFVEYDIDVQKTAKYSISFRAATERNDVKIEISDAKGNVISTTPINSTLGWQQWQTFASAPFELKAGKQTIRLKATGNRVSLNWLEFK